jgi:hypothetical protein
MFKIWEGIYVVFKSRAARESLVSDIPAGDGKIANLFLIVYSIKGMKG